MSTAVDQVIRSMRAESIRTAAPGPLWTVLLPVAVLLPLVITGVIAAVAERFARIPGQVAVTQVGTSNAAYWVITITVVLVAVAAAYGTSCEFASGAAEYVYAVVPGRWPAGVGKWLFYGLLGGCFAAATTAVVLFGAPRISPLVYGQVALTDAVGLRLIWTVPVLAFFAAGLGVGIGAVVRVPAAAVGLILFWAYVVESAVGYLPGGVSAQQFMPFLNGIYASGQDIVLTPPWGPDIALLYVCAVFTLVFACGQLRAPIKGGSKR